MFCAPSTCVMFLCMISNIRFFSQVIIVANTGRCGSTLLAQMFEAVEGWKHIICILDTFQSNGMEEDLI